MLSVDALNCTVKLDVANTHQTKQQTSAVRHVRWLVPVLVHEPEPVQQDAAPVPELLLERGRAPGPGPADSGLQPVLLSSVHEWQDSVL